MGDQPEHCGSGDHDPCEELLATRLGPMPVDRLEAAIEAGDIRFVARFMDRMADVASYHWERGMLQVVDCGGRVTLQVSGGCIDCTGDQSR
jgi:hypothetical protein